MSDVEENNDRPRTPVNWIVPILTAVAIILGPPLIHPVTSGWGVLTGLGTVALIAGLLDAATHRFNYSIMVIVGAAYLFAMVLYFNEGTWIYLPLIVLVTLVGQLVGKRVARCFDSAVVDSRVPASAGS